MVGRVEGAQAALGGLVVGSRGHEAEKVKEFRREKTAVFIRIARFKCLSEAFNALLILPQLVLHHYIDEIRRGNQFFSFGFVPHCRLLIVLPHYLPQ